MGHGWRSVPLWRYRLGASLFDWIATCSGAPSHCRHRGSGQGIVLGELRNKIPQRLNGRAFRIVERFVF